MIDLPPVPVASEVSLLWSDIAHPTSDDHVAYRDGQRFVARLERVRALQSHPVKFNPDASYLITGGLGTLALRVAQWMAQNGARHLILTSRRDPSGQNLDALTQLGAQVLTVQADVSDQPAMAALFARIQASLPPLRGIVHAAGLPGFQPVQDLTYDALQSVLRPKVAGAWILHQLSRDLELDFFVSFSSIASVWGSKNQAHYAAANHFLDILAHHRRALGLPALSINWGPWAGGGMASDDAQSWLHRMGVSALAPDQGVLALAHLLPSSQIQTVVAQVDWKRFKELYEVRAKRPLFENIQVSSSQPATPSASKPPLIIEELKHKNPSARRAHLFAFIQTEVAIVLGFDPAHRPDPEQGFFDMGMDSLLAVELKNRLAQTLGISLLSTLAFDHPNIQNLTDFLLQELGWESGVEPLKAMQATSSEIAHLREDQIEASIADRLERLEALVRKK
jgi:hypothetical protein